jgi:LuxR family maltose regulon positive regulatory protein
MAQTIPIVQVDALIYQRDGEECSLAVGTPAWYAWLETVTVFAFSSAHGTFTARKEQLGNRRGGRYWKAYRKRNGKLHRAYLGKSEELTLERLNAMELAPGRACSHAFHL